MKDFERASIQFMKKKAHEQDSGEGHANSRQTGDFGKKVQGSLKMSQTQHHPSAAADNKFMAEATLSSQLVDLDSNYNPNKKQNFLQELSEPRRQLDITSGTNLKRKMAGQSHALDEKRDMQRKQLELQRQQIILQ